MIGKISVSSVCGPGSGSRGGTIVFQGTKEHFLLSDGRTSKAIREWQSVVSNFPKSDYKKKSVDKLEHYGIKVADAGIPPAASTPRADEPEKKDPPKPDANSRIPLFVLCAVIISVLAALLYGV